MECLLSDNVPIPQPRQTYEGEGTKGLRELFALATLRSANDRLVGPSPEPFPAPLKKKSW